MWLCCCSWWSIRMHCDCCVCLFGFLACSSTTRLYCGRAPRQSVWQFYVLPHMRQRGETMTSVTAGHIIVTPTQPVGSEDRTLDLLTRCHALYRLSYCAPHALWWILERNYSKKRRKKGNNIIMQTCHFDLMQNLNECENKIWVCRKESEFDYHYQNNF